MGPIKALVLDFDSTISVPTFLRRVNQWAVADNVTLFNSMSTEEQLANFGGKERIEQLATCLHHLRAASVELFIVSIGYKAAYVPHLQSAGLLGYFDSQRLYGQDSPELRATGFVKGTLIAQIMQARGWSHDDVLFVDDSIGHIEKARDICRTLHVTGKGGMKEAELSEIRRAAGV
eukprot:CAMPEP_0119062858 /NCGR_PEP_ID=MMETSP1178-20130426/6353_1 /TAXON_ID=33656 /ORGANISM="unid sp, Strain CCMP2000" /LENGTH=175 /DNA_ID=CAMNT_0007044167 /DNA_START=32 /DNA_END=559 /DNA_ORIENTATION=+